MTHVKSKKQQTIEMIFSIQIRLRSQILKSSNHVRQDFHGMARTESSNDKV